MLRVQIGNLFDKNFLKGIHPRHVAMQDDAELVAAYAEAIAVTSVHIENGLGNGNETLVASLAAGLACLFVIPRRREN